MRSRKPVIRWRRRPIWLGSLRRTVPISDRWGADRGTTVARYYVERFLVEHSHDIRGRVLEVKDSRYTELFGAAVESSDVLDIEAVNPRATIVADLADAAVIPSDSFDCFILTQTLQFIYDFAAAIREAHRVLRTGGVLLVTVPAVSRLDRRPGFATEPADDYWRFTADACTKMFGSVFGTDNVAVHAYGNVLAAIAFLAGLAREDLSDRELDEQDDLFPVLVAVRAVKG